MREKQGGSRGAANGERTRPTAVEKPRRDGPRRETGASGKHAEAKAKILAKLRRLHPMD